jgi:hypothetical protein
MADVKISGLPASTVPLAGTEVLPIVQGGATKQVSIANVTAGRAIAASTVQATTTMGVGAATPSASGAGITFPATQSASSNANTLDDYEEGTFTPNQGADLTVVGAFSSAGTYVKIGRVVTITGKVTGGTSVAVTSGGVILSNLPFTGSTDSVGSTTNNALSVAGGVYATTNTSLYATTAIAATTNIFFSLTYFTAT